MMKVGTRVEAKVPTDEHGGYVRMAGIVDMTVESGTECRVLFDDRLIYGGTGRHWFPESELEVVVPV